VYIVGVADVKTQILDMLDLSREAKKEIPARHPYSMRSVLHTAASYRSARAKKEGRSPCA
jgi:hypothetical protein